MIGDHARQRLQQTADELLNSTLHKVVDAWLPALLIVVALAAFMGALIARAMSP